MDIKIFAENIEETAQKQLDTLTSLEAFKDAKIRIMPDVHAGAGCVIGFTADLGDKVIPNIVGVDVNCGVRVEELGKAAIDFASLDEFIKSNIPAGFAVNARKQADFDLTELRCYDSLINVSRLGLSLGSLGGGNHFIEVDEGADGSHYLVIHTGSRNLGLQVAKIYQAKAVEHCRSGRFKEEVSALISKLKNEGREPEIEAELTKLRESFRLREVPNELCYLEGQDREDYLHDMRICQRFAAMNREIIASKIVSHLGLVPLGSFESVHNYIDDSNMIRKGAIAAHKGQKLIIPLNMRDGSVIGVGKGNPDWNESAPHGAGRIMSRAEARRTLSLEDFRAAMAGVFTTTATQGTIDESPMAYKDASGIIGAIAETADVLDVVRPLYNFKAEGGE